MVPSDTLAAPNLPSVRVLDGDASKTRSGPNRPAADIGSFGGVIFQIVCAYYAYFGTHGLLKLLRRLQFHRNSGFELETRCEKIGIS